jgi:hypothetical protein
MRSAKTTQQQDGFLFAAGLSRYRIIALLPEGVLMYLSF